MIKRLFLASLLALAGAMALSQPAAAVDPSQAIVVATCGTPPFGYYPDANKPLTQDTTGKLCDSGSSATVTSNSTIVAPLGSAAASAGVAVTVSKGVYTSSSALAANQVVVTGAHQLVSFDVAADSTLSAAAWWIMIYDATSAPSDGAVTPAKCYALPSGATTFNGAFNIPVNFATGIVIGVSTTGCFSKTASTHAFISGDYQ